ncbi:MAG: peptide ABC transporter substrate-binding protein [Roseovarius sp.]|nr:peptide ABC transporter substrate-binding protein [Roseovarius sp.]
MRSGQLSTTLSRRSLMAGMAGTGAILALGTRAARAQEPKRGGHVRYGVRGGSTSDTLDPSTFGNTFMRTLGYGLYNTLVEIDANGAFHPELLESYEGSDGAKTWVFTLRQGISFHDGKPLTADDVIASIRHHLGEVSKSGMKALLTSIANITREDDHTIRFELDAGNADFPVIFTDYRMMILPEKDGSIDMSGNGTGGYVLKQFEPGVRAAVERNPNYWRSDRAFFDSAEIISMSDPTSRQNALMTGGVDIIDQVDLKTVQLLKRQKGVAIMNTSGGLHYVYAMNTTLDPFDTVHVRQALKYGVDREALLKKVLRGYGSIGNDHPIPRGMQFYASDLEQTAYDPDKAKFHLKEAGLDGLDLALHVSDGLYPGAVDGVTIYKENLSAAGVNLDVAREPADGYFSNVWLKKPFVASYWGARPTADIMFSSAYASSAKWNETHWKNEAFDKLLEAARVELDESKRAEMYHDMQAMVRDEGGAVIPLFADNVFAANEKVGHPDVMSGAWELDGGRSIERWWLAE